MALNETLYKRLRDAGFSHQAAVVMADPASTEFSGGGFGGGATNKPRVPLVVFIGESNSGGIGANADLTAPELAVRPAVQILNNTTLAFESLDIGTNNLIGHTGLEGSAGTGHGWEAGLATSAESGAWGDTPVYLVKAGQGGSILSQWENTDPYWSTFVSRFNAAVAAIRAAGNDPDVYVWATIGINDLGFGTTAPAFKVLLADWLARIRATISSVVGVKSAPITLTLLTPAYRVFDQPIFDVAATNPLNFLVKTSDAPLVDAAHWNAAGMKIIAARMAEVSLARIGQGQQYDASLSSPRVIGRDTALEAKTIPPTLYTVFWKDLGTTYSQDGLGRIISNGATSGGGQGVTTVDANSLYVVTDLVSPAATSGVVTLIDSDATPNFVWASAGSEFTAGVFVSDGRLYFTNGPASVTDIGAAVLPSKVRMTNSGDDCVVSVSTDAGESWTKVYTAIDALAGLTTGYVKAMFAGPSAGQQITVATSAAPSVGVLDARYKTGSNTTALRPDAVVLGAGAMFYDTSLSKPIWSDGTIWRDSTGAAA